MAIFEKYFKPRQTATEIDSVNAICFDESEVLALTKGIYSKIMYEVADRTSIPDSVDVGGYTASSYDSYSPAKDGLVGLVVDAMVLRRKVFYRKFLVQGVWLFEEVSLQEAIVNDVLMPDILELDFTKFNESMLLNRLMALMNSVLKSLSTNIIISTAVVYKIHALSEMIDNTQNTEALEKQIKSINDSLVQGEAGVLDAKSDISMPTLSTKPAEEAIGFIYKMVSHITGLPSSYLFSDVVGGLGDTSNSEENRLNVGLKRYFNAIWFGVLYSVYDTPFKYKVMVSDIDGMIKLYEFLAVNENITSEGKLVLAQDNSVLDADLLEF